MPKEKETDFSLEEALVALNKKFGESYISPKNQYYEHKRTSFGVFSLDARTGGGIPEGKIVTIAGEYSSGKTTVALLAAAQFQKKNKAVVYIDTDHGLDLEWAHKLGVDTSKNWLHCQPDYIEQVSDTIETLLMTGEVGLIIFDSVANTPSKSELDESCDKKSMGGIGAEMAQMMRKITKRLTHVKTSVIIINQLRDKIGVTFGNAEYMPGGRALKFQSDIIIWLRPSNWLPETGEPRIGKVSKFRVTKNRTAPPLQVGEFAIYFEGSVNNNEAIVKEALAMGIVFKAGAWYYYSDDTKKTQGLLNFVEKLITENKIEEIKDKVLHSE